MDFNDYKYQHIERWDTDEVQYLKGLDTLYVQPKLDGTNALIAYNKDEDKLIIGSRNRFITVDNDNQGFARFVTDNAEKYLNFFRKNPNVILYGEFLINHVYKVKPQYFKNFYIFDVMNTITGKYWNPGFVTTELAKYGLDTVPFILVPKGVDVPEFCKSETMTKLGRFLLDDNFTHGEGFVIKDFSGACNQYGRTTWAKIVNDKPFESTGKNMFEVIRGKFFTDEWIEKETAKYIEKYPNDFNGDIRTSKLLPKYCNILIHEFIKEECANMVFYFKFPRISFQELKVSLNNWIKEFLDKHPRG